MSHDGYYPPGEDRRCTAKSKQSGQRCKNWSVPGRSVCRFHGGLAGRPIVHGRYSKSLGRLRHAYEAALGDPALMELRDTIAILDVLVQKAAERADANDTAEFRSKALALFRSAQAATDTGDMARLLRELGRLLERGVEEDKALRQLGEAVDRLARRQEKAWDLRLSAANAINARDMVALLGRFADIVLDEADGEVAGRIIARIDGEVLGGGKAADRLQAGDDPARPAVLDVSGQPGGLHDGDPGLGTLEETEGDSPGAS